MCMLLGKLHCVYMCQVMSFLTVSCMQINNIAVIQSLSLGLVSLGSVHLLRSPPSYVSLSSRKSLSWRLNFAGVALPFSYGLTGRETVQTHSTGTVSQVAGKQSQLDLSAPPVYIRIMRLDSSAFAFCIYMDYRNTNAKRIFTGEWLIVACDGACSANLMCI